MTKILREYQTSLEKLKEFEPVLNEAKDTIKKDMPVDLMIELLDFVGTDKVSITAKHEGKEIEITWKLK